MRNEISSSVAFELTGEFGGFIFTAAGKRRMVLRTPEGELLLKVPKELRRRVVAHFRPGQAVWISGDEEIDVLTGVRRRIVSRMLPADAAAAINLSSSAQVARAKPIRICSKRNCWRSGGRELWLALQEALATRGLSEAIRLKAVGCMDRCEAAPNAECAGRAFQRCLPADVELIVAKAAAGLETNGAAESSRLPHAL